MSVIINKMKNFVLLQARASSARAMLLATDVSNLLQCVRQILPAICTSAGELTGCNVHSQLVTDVHAKCHALLTCLLLRATPLAILHKVNDGSFHYIKPE